MLPTGHFVISFHGSRIGRGPTFAALRPSWLAGWGWCAVLRVQKEKPKTCTNIWYTYHITYIYIYIYIHIRICMTYKNRSLSVWSEIMLNDVWCDIRWCCVLQDNLKKFILVESSRYIFFRVIHCMIEHVDVNAYAWRVDPAPIKQEELKAFGISLWVRNAL